MRYTEKEFNTEIHSPIDAIKCLATGLLVCPFRLVNEISKKLLFLGKDNILRIIRTSIILNVFSTVFVIVYGYFVTHKLNLSASGVCLASLGLSIAFLIIAYIVCYRVDSPIFKIDIDLTKMTTEPIQLSNFEIAQSTQEPSNLNNHEENAGDLFSNTNEVNSKPATDDFFGGGGDLFNSNPSDSNDMFSSFGSNSDFFNMGNEVEQHNDLKDFFNSDMDYKHEDRKEELNNLQEYSQATMSSSAFENEGSLLDNAFSSKSTSIDSLLDSEADLSNNALGMEDLMGDNSFFSP